VLLDWIEWEGPLRRTREKSRRTGLVPSDDATPEVVAEHLQRFDRTRLAASGRVRRAGGYIFILPHRREAGESRPKPNRGRLQGVLTSRNFLTSSRASRWPASVHRLGTASRLSYFLWSSIRMTPLRAAQRRHLNGED